MKTLRTDPGAKRLMESLRNMGYDCSTAIADLVDNCIAADASEIHIDIIPKRDSRLDKIPQQDFHPAAIMIADNGKGMSREDLHEAMRFGTFQEHSLRDLGKYGLGLKTASLSQCRILTVSSKAKSGEGVRPRRHCMRWDIDHVYETNNWNLLVPEDDELEPWEKASLNHSIADENGTVVLWTNLDGTLSLLSSSDVYKREKFLAHLIEEVSFHLRMVFHRFMQGAVTGNRKLNIYVCGVPLTPWDPFCRSENTQELGIVRLPIISLEPDGSKMEEAVTISPFVLPREDEFTSQEAWRDASGQKSWNQQQGFYFYRNNRLLQAGGWSRIRTPDEHAKLLRIAIDFPGELDRAFAINITKMRAGIPVEIRDKIKLNVSTWVKIARARYDGQSRDQGILPKGSLQSMEGDSKTTFVGNRSVDTNQTTSVQNETDGGDFVITLDEDGEMIMISLPPQHELSRIFPIGMNKWDSSKFSEVVLNILEAVYSGRTTIDRVPIQTLKKIYQNHL